MMMMPLQALGLLLQYAAAHRPPAAQDRLIVALSVIGTRREWRKWVRDGWVRKAEE